MKFSAVLCSALAAVVVFASTPLASAYAQQEEYFDRSVSIPDSQLLLIVNVRIASRDAGVLQEVILNEGDEVSTGSLIARLDRELYDAELNAASKELAIAQEESENDIDSRYAKVSEEVNRKILDRSRRAVQQYARAVSKTELEQLRLELERSKLSGEQAERSEKVKSLTVNLKREQVNIAELRLGNRDIKSPANGIVTQIYRQPGEWVQSGEPIARIIGLDRLRVVCRCELSKAKPAELGERILFRPSNDPDAAPIVGKISFVSPEIEPVNQDYEVWAEIDNTDRKLLPGFGGTIEIELKE
jgi:macrolide-specific efflux system membrane fusion protein